MHRSICRFCSHAITDLYGDWFHHSDAAGSRTACAVCVCTGAMPTGKSGRKAQWTDERPVPQAKKQFAAVRQNGVPHGFRPEINYLARAYTNYAHRLLAGIMPPDERLRMLDAADWPLLLPCPLPFEAPKPFLSISSSCLSLSFEMSTASISLSS